MNRRLLLTVLTVALAAAWGGSPGARADRLGGNFRGPGDKYIVREDTAQSTPDSGTSGGGGGTPAPPTGGGSTGGSGDGTSGGGDGTSAGGGDSGGGTGGGDSGGGDSGGGDSGGGDSGGGDSGGTPSSPDTGGGGDSGGDSGGSSGGGSAPPPSSGDTTGGGASAPSVSGGGGGAGVGGKKTSQDDADKIWPFYFEGAKEEYIATVLARRPVARISPPKTSTYVLSTQPEPARDRRLIGETDRQEAMALVVGRLNDGDSHVRDAAVLALGKSGFKEALPFLQNVATSDADFAVREDALLALGLSGHSDVALPYLLKALTGSSTDRREKRAAYAALGLGLLGTPEGAVEPLRKLYETSVSRVGMEDEAACSALALGMLGDAAALPLFEKVLAARNSAESVKCFTLHALGRYGQHADEKVRGSALRAVIASLGGKTEVRQSALLALGSFNDLKAIQALAKEGFSKADPYAKNFSAHSLGRIASRLGPTSKEYALIAKELAEIAKNDKKDKWLFQAGTLALASMACGDHEKTLMEMVPELKKLDLNSQSSVVLALGLLGTDSPATEKQLQTLFSSRSSGTGVQAYAGLALALSGDASAAADLSKTLTSDSRPHADVARTAALSIGLVGGADEARVLVDVLTGKVAVQQADSARFFLKGAAVQGIGLIGDAESVKLLKPVLESSDWEQRAFATAALGYLMEPKAEYRIAPRLSDLFRHHNYHVALPVVKQVQSAL